MEDITCEQPSFVLEPIELKPPQKEDNDDLFDHLFYCRDPACARAGCASWKDFFYTLTYEDDLVNLGEDQPPTNDAEIDKDIAFVMEDGFRQRHINLDQAIMDLENSDFFDEMM